MERKWTEAQSAAIETQNKTLLVSAAAGSGKTAVLTERIIRSLTDKENPSDLSEMLIVTFTRAAAAELRQRIFAAISNALANDIQNKHLNEQLVKLSSAKICTIDSFYLDIVRSNFDKLDISPSFKTADTEELDIISKNIMEDTIDAFYESRKDEFTKIADCFVGIRNSNRLSDILLSLYSNTESFPDGIEFLRNCAEQTDSTAELEFFETGFGRYLRENILSQTKYFLNSLELFYNDILQSDNASAAYSASFAYDKKFCEKLCDLIKNGTYSECREYLNSFSPIKLGRLDAEFKTEQIENAKNFRTDFSKKIRELRTKLFSFEPKSISKAMKQTAKITLLIYELLSDFSHRLENEKRQKNIYSFNDIRNFALKLLVDSDGNPTKTALEYREQFSDIYIDEYQDVDQIQDLIFRSIAKPTARFMVGDIKQSIYSFRGAEPQVFASYKKTFPNVFSSTNDDNSASIFMSNNFRCDENVIDFTNSVCSFLFSTCAKKIGYTEDDDLVFSKSVENRVVDELPVEVSVIVPSLNEENGEDTDEDEEKIRMVEARYIASRISRLLSTEYKANGEKIKPEDIAILFRSKTIAPYIRQALNEIGIETSDNSDSHYFENPDVLLMLCLLNSIDNPQRDIYLAGLLRSPFFGFSMDELVTVRSECDISFSLYDALCVYKENNNELGRKCSAFDKTLGELRSVAASMPVDKLLQYLFSTELFASNGLVNSEDNNNLLRLYEYARKYESASFKGLYNFIVYINKIIDEGKKIESASDDISTGKVALMTIHQSKGLEFPVCFLCNAGAGINRQDTRESLVLDSSLGVAMKIADDTGFARIATPMREAITRMISEKQTEEEMRVLYVALTRARERLFVTASSTSSVEKLRWKAYCTNLCKNQYSLYSANSYLDWILAALYGDGTSPFYSLKFFGKREVSTEEKAVEFTSNRIPQSIASHNSEISAKLLKERFSYVYPYREITKMPAKISVSKLLSEARSYIDNDDASPISERLEACENNSKYTPHAALTKEAYDNVTPAMRGTATHLFLQFCDFENVERYGVDNELCRLTEKKFIPPKSEDLVFKNEIEAFFKSELYFELKSAKKIIREQRFNILLPPEIFRKDEEFLKQAEGEELAVQGVIDLLFIKADGSIVLCDYKTDRISHVERNDENLLRAKMSERHGEQLKYYIESVKRLFGKAPSKTLIYSTHAGKAVEIR